MRVLAITDSPIHFPRGPRPGRGTELDPRPILPHKWDTFKWVDMVTLGCEKNIYIQCEFFVFLTEPNDTFHDTTFCCLTTSLLDRPNQSVPPEEPPSLQTDSRPLTPPRTILFSLPLLEGSVTPCLPVSVLPTLHSLRYYTSFDRTR